LIGLQILIITGNQVLVAIRSFTCWFIMANLFLLRIANQTYSIMKCHRFDEVEKIYWILIEQNSFHERMLIIETKQFNENKFHNKHRLWALLEWSLKQFKCDVYLNKWSILILNRNCLSASRSWHSYKKRIICFQSIRLTWKIKWMEMNISLEIWRFNVKNVTFSIDENIKSSSFLFLLNFSTTKKQNFKSSDEK
jgi:hypothetical protein